MAEITLQLYHRISSVSSYRTVTINDKTGQSKSIQTTKGCFKPHIANKCFKCLSLSNIHASQKETRQQIKKAATGKSE